MESYSNPAKILVERTVKTSRSQNYFLCLLFLLLGLVFVLVGAWEGIVSFQLEISGVHATGAVVDSQVHTGKDANGRTTTYYDTTIGFQTPDGIKHEIHDTYPGTPGQFVDVVYLAGEPGSAVVFSFWNLFTKPVAFILLGTLFSVLFFKFLVGMRRRDQEVDQLIGSGVRAAGTIVGFVQIGQTALVNGRVRQMFQAVVKVTSPAQTEPTQINSDNISLDIQSVAGLVDREVPVYFDRNNPASYFVDLRSIEQYDINLAPDQPSS